MATIHDKLTAVCNAIRRKTGGTEPLNLDEMASELDAIQERSESDLIADGATVIVPPGNYRGDCAKSVAVVEQAVPEISVNEYGVVVAEVTQDGGYVNSGIKTETLQLPTKSEETIIPGVDAQTIEAGQYITGAQTIAGDGNLIPENIRHGVKIFGVNGTLDVHDGSGVGCASDDMLKAVIERNETVLYHSSVTMVASGIFANYSGLTAVSFPACTLVGNSAFYNCSKMQDVCLPQCSYIKSSAFASCRSLTDINMPTCEVVEDNAFYSCGSITSIYMPKCSIIGSSAFYRPGTNLKEVNFPECLEVKSNAFGSAWFQSAFFPKCISVGSHAFQTNSNLIDISFPECQFIYDGAFRACNSLSSAHFPKCTLVSSSAFGDCSKLTSISFPNCSVVGSRAFYHCLNLKSVYLPSCTSVGTAAFSQCVVLSKVELPLCKTVGSGAFSACSMLGYVSIPACSMINSSAFYNCFRLSNLYLEYYAASSYGTSICSLAGSSVFYNTPYMGYSTYFSGKPYIYVPSSLLTRYKTMTNWAYFSSYFSAIEGGSQTGGDGGSATE